MDDDGQRVHRFAGDENVELDHGRDAITGQMVIERRIAARGGFQAVVEIENDFVQRQFISQQHAPAADVFEFLLVAALLFEQLQDLADEVFARNDGGVDDRLFDLFDKRGIGKLGGIIDFDDRSVHRVTR